MSSDDLPLFDYARRKAEAAAAEPPAPVPPAEPDPLPPSLVSTLRALSATENPIDAMVGAMTPAERAALLERLGPPEPWETEGGIESAPDPKAVAIVSAYRKRRWRKAAGDDSAAGGGA